MHADGLDADLDAPAAIAHRLPGIGAQVEHDLLDLDRVGEYVQRLGCEARFERGLRRQRRTQDIERLQSDRLQRLRLALGALPMTESEDLAHQVARALGCAAHLRQGLHCPVSLPLHDVLGRKLGIAEDRTEHVVEIVGDATGQRADRLDLLRLPQVRLEQAPGALGLGALGHVANDDDVLSRIARADLRYRDLELQDLPVARRGWDFHAAVGGLRRTAIRRRCERRKINGRQQRRQRAPDDLFRRCAEQGKCRRIGFDDGAVGIGDHDAGRGRADDRLQPIAAFVQLARLAHQVGDFEPHADEVVRRRAPFVGIDPLAVLQALQDRSAERAASGEPFGEPGRLTPDRPRDAPLRNRFTQEIGETAADLLLVMDPGIKCRNLRVEEDQPVLGVVDLDPARQFVERLAQPRKLGLGLGGAPLGSGEALRSRIVVWG